MTSIRSRAPVASSPAVRQIMQSVRSSDTDIEKKLRSVLHQSGLRFRIGRKPESDIRCEADIVFGPAKVCVFVDGCYWHGCPQHFKPPRTNRHWWMEKITDNVKRDHRQSEALTARGWLVIRVWEHDLSDEIATRIAKWISRLVKARRLSTRRSLRGGIKRWGQ